MPLPGPSQSDPAAEVLALRTILLNLHFTVAKGETITAEGMQAIIERADVGKAKKAAERLAAASKEKPGGAGADTGPFGALTAQHGDYVPGTVDYETNPAATVTLLSNDQPASGYTEQLNQYTNNINQSNIPYNPLSTNSNAYAEGAAKFLGLTPPATPPVLAPGHDTTLPVPPPPPPTPPSPPPCFVARCY